MNADIEPSVRKFVEDNFLYRAGVKSFSDDTSFLATGLIDSTGILELVLFVETTFGIKVADEEMLPENLDSVAQLCAYVRRKVAAKSEGGAAKGVAHAR